MRSRWSEVVINSSINYKGLTWKQTILCSESIKQMEYSYNYNYLWLEINWILFMRVKRYRCYFILIVPLFPYAHLEFWPSLRYRIFSIY